ncbi:CDP-glycerol glycerophosphotransferase family protein [Parageobacillus toebii]|uniref:CDP-glycerol glycerophosphotransferase family protein n=1 Tax=Parageobacillus toebii TaxID=153151 RepID=UPI0035C75887
MKYKRQEKNNKILEIVECIHGRIFYKDRGWRIKMKRNIFDILKRRFFQLIIQVLLFPVYLLSKFVPKKDNLICLGSSRGLYYSDNAKYLYEYMLNNNHGLEFYWLTKNKGLVQKNKDKKFVYLYSLKGFYLLIRANIVVLTHHLDDLFPPLMGGCKIIQLWHGTPLKKIGYLADGWGERSKLENLIIKFLFKCFPYLEYNKCDYLITSSPFINDVMAKSFNIPRSNIFPLGQPRNDVFFQEYEEKSQKNKKIYSWLPTHRGRTNIKVKDLLLNYGFNLKYFNEFLEKNNAIFVIKPHFTELNEVIDLTNDFENITIYKEADPYPLLQITDILLTDYSSVYFDYLLTKKPIIFTPFDYSYYIKNIAGFNFNYDEVTPGPKCMNWEEVIKEIIKIEENDPYFNDREKICEKFNLYLDGRNSERVVEFIKEVMR